MSSATHNDAGADALETLKSMFPETDVEILQAVLEATKNQLDQAIERLLDIIESNPRPQQYNDKEEERHRQLQIDEEFARELQHRLQLEAAVQARSSASNEDLRRSLSVASDGVFTARSSIHMSIYLLIVTMTDSKGSRGIRPPIVCGYERRYVS
jgi:hypothetical protein